MLLGGQTVDEIKYGAICVAAIGVQEIPRGEWNDLITILCNNA